MFLISRAETSFCILIPLTDTDDDNVDTGNDDTYTGDNDNEDTDKSNTDNAAINTLHAGPCRAKHDMFRGYDDHKFVPQFFVSVMNRNIPVYMEFYYNMYNLTCQWSIAVQRGKKGGFQV